MYALGAYAVLGHRAVAVALGGTVAVLLHFKAELHGAVNRLGDGDLRAIMQFVLLALVVLPVLPDATFGPYAVFNPREMWLMAVLIVGLSLAGYIALKFFGERAGIVAGGLLGGLISSTATTVSWSRLTRGRPETARAAALVIVIASTVVYGRVLAEIAAVAPAFLPRGGPADPGAGRRHGRVRRRALAAHARRGAGRPPTASSRRASRRRSRSPRSTGSCCSRSRS